MDEWGGNRARDGRDVGGGGGGTEGWEIGQEGDEKGASRSSLESLKSTYHKGVFTGGVLQAGGREEVLGELERAAVDAMSELVA